MPADAFMLVLTHITAQVKMIPLTGVISGKVSNFNKYIFLRCERKECEQQIKCWISVLCHVGDYLKLLNQVYAFIYFDVNCLSEKWGNTP